MNGAASKPSVTKAFKEVVYPLIEADGYIPLGTKLYSRIVDSDVLQSLLINVDSRGRRSYGIQYCSLLISEPREYLTLEIGGTFEKYSSGRSYGAFSEEILEKSILRAASAYTEEVRPVLQQHDSKKGLLEAYLAKDKQQNYENISTIFSIACIYAALGEIKKAKKYAKKTYSLCRATENDEQKRDWVTSKKSFAAQLVQSLDDGRPDVLLQQWREYTIENMKLEKLLNAKSRTQHT